MTNADKTTTVLTALCLAASILLRTCPAETELPPIEGRAIAECLQRFGGPTIENAQRLQRFKEWSDTYEEIPCFTNCYLGKMFDFYNESEGFVETNVIRHFGQPIFNACRAKLTEGNNSCEVAYNGFHCIVSLENDPFILIESKDQVSSEAKAAMKECLHKFEPFEWELLSNFSSFPAREPIPCFTRCFIERLHLFNVRSRQWNMESMRMHLDYPAEDADIEHCLAIGKRRARNSCAWMYRELTCFAKAK